MRRLLSLLLCLWLSALAKAETLYVCVPLAQVHKAPNAASELVTEAFLWEPAQVTREQGRWCHVFITDQYRTAKGYPGWILKEQLVKAAKPTSQWMVTAPRVDLRPKPDPKSPAITWAYLGTRLSGATVEEEDPQWVAVSVPGRQDALWAPRAQLAPSKGLERPKEGTPLVETASLLQGTRYLWGGMSTKGIDCSGLTFTSYRRHGYAIPRDADQQFQWGVAVEVEDLRAGDLLFFGKDADHITHVGMYVGDGKFIHASSSLGGVTVSEFDEKFQSWFQGARRILK